MPNSVEARTPQRPAAAQPLTMAHDVVSRQGQRWDGVHDRRRRSVTGWASRTRSIWLVAAHLAAFSVIYLAAYLVRFDGAVPRALWTTALATLPFVLGAKLIAVLATGSHRGWLHYATFADMAVLTEVATIGSAGLVLISALNGQIAPVPASVLLIDWAGTMLVLCGARAATRLRRERYNLRGDRRKAHRVLIVGASEAGEALVRKLRVSSSLGMHVVGLIDPSGAMRGRVLAGLNVLGTLHDIRSLAARHRIGTVMVPLPAVPPATLRDLVAECNTIGVKVQVVPDFDALLTGALTVQPRDVAIQDLLCRPPVRLDMDSISGFLRGRVVLVTGAAGSIGSEICRQVLAFGPSRLIAVDHNENGVFYLERELAALAATAGCEVVPCVASITDANRLRSVLSHYRPAVVLHAAAHKHVPMMESNPGEAVKNNVFGTRLLVEETLRSGAEAFVMISTDKAVNPTSVMGACKRLAEMVVQSYSSLTDTRLVTVRFGNVLGSTGSVVPIFREQIRNGGPVTVTHPDMTRFFMTIPEAAQLVLQAGALGSGGEIFVLDMGEPVRILDLARDMVRLSGLTEGREIEIAFSGLRPGEKLYEELYDDAEERVSTPHPKIFRARHRPSESEVLWKGLEQLARAVDHSPEKIVALITELVPEYHPNRAAVAEPVATETVSEPVALCA